MEIIKMVLKEVEEIVGYKCDVCNIDLKIDSSLDLNTVTYSEPSDSNMTNFNTIRKHVCSIKCLNDVLRNTYFGANIFLSDKLIKGV